MSAVIASDFVEHIIQRLLRRRPLTGALIDDPALVRSHSGALLTMCSAHHSFSSLSPSLVAAAAVVSAVRPMIKEGEEEVVAAVEELTKIEKVKEKRQLKSMLYPCMVIRSFKKNTWVTSTFFRRPFAM